MSVWGTGILNGMRISMRNMMRGPITVQYPRERITLPERARWAVQMKMDDQGNHKCTGCLACEKACPDYIIKIDITTDEERNKNIDRWHYEIGACMMCGLCVEACPFDAIEQGHDYELARFSAEELAVDLLYRHACRQAQACRAPRAGCEAGRCRRGGRCAVADAPAPADTPAPPAAAEEVSADE